MNKLLSSMTAKIILFICLVAGLSLVNIIAIYSKHMAEAQVRHEEDIATLIDYLQVPVEDFIFTGNLTNLQRLANRTINGGLVAGIVVTHADGKHLASFPERLDYSLPVKEVPIYQSLDEGDIALIPAAGTSPRNEKLIGRMIVYLNNAKQQEALSALKFELVISCLATFILVIVVFFLVRLFFISPLTKVFKSATNILEGHYDKVTSLEQNDEIGKLSRYLKEIADDFSMRNKVQRDQLRAIIQSNADVTAIQKERDTVMDRLLDGITPSLQEAMSTIKFLHDKPSLQANLAKSVLFALSLAEETKSVLTAHAHKGLFAPEKISFDELFELVGEYINFFSVKSSIHVDLRMDKPSHLTSHYVIVDKKEIMRLFAHIFELLEQRGNDSASGRVKFLLIFEAVENDRMIVDLMVRISNCDISTELCAAINHYFASDSSQMSIDALKQVLEPSPHYGLQLFTLLGLKRLVESLHAQYAIMKSGHRDIMHTYSFSIHASASEAAIDHQISKCHVQGRQDLCVIGASQFIRQLMHKHFANTDPIKFVSYELTGEQHYNAQTHYIVDLISDKVVGLEIARKILAIGSTTHNLVGVIRSSESREHTLFTWCDVDFDLFFYDTVSVDDLRRIKSRKHVSERSSAVLTIIDEMRRPNDD